jgi:hypothetical protein
MIITSHMQNIIQIYPCLLKLSRKQDTILKIGDFSTKHVRPSHFLFYEITWVNMDGFEYFFACGF